jgi:hypothetical protein
MKLMELYQDKITGAISGLDRIRFRGTLRWLASREGLGSYMHQAGILLKDFSGWVEGLTRRIRSSCEAQAAQRGIKALYLMGGSADKEKLARSIATERGITEGSICLLSVVEPCLAPLVKGNKARKMLEVVMAPRKCVWLYHYFDDPRWGFGHVRIQSWVPFNVFICLNGRHWLERQMQRQGLGYIKDGNCFPWLEDMAAAQGLLDRQLQSDWSRILDGLTFGSCPALRTVLHPLRPEYYWSADETEWATDIMFDSAEALATIYPSLIHHALRVSDSPSVMRYFGRRDLSRAGRIKGRAPCEVMTDARRFYEGIRVKHWLNRNSVKLYSKSGSILRIETTINHTRGFKVFRHPDDDQRRAASWQNMRKGVSDLHRRCQVSRQCNERYAEALATAQVQEKLKEVAGPACNHLVKDGKRYRGLNPWQQEDYRLLLFLAKGEHALNGFRNHDLRRWLYPEAEGAAKEQRKKYSGRATRRIKLLRAHGLVRKVPKVNRYVLTEKGRKFSSALLTASALDIKQLTEMAA